jgi:hypothetical protein
MLIANYPRKKLPLTKNDKITNRKLSSLRVLNENVIGMLKRFGLRFNLFAGIYNHELHI